MLEIDSAEAVAELTAAFEAYERALIANDIPAVNDFFWNDPRTIRFGTRSNERHYGHDDIAAFRLRRGTLDQRRTLQNRHITAFGRDMGTAHVEYGPHGSDRIGRQSQTWIAHCRRLENRQRARVVRELSRRCAQRQLNAPRGRRSA